MESAIDYEAEYSNSRRVPESGQIIEHWRAASDAYRPTAHADLDLPYGPGPRNRYDLFWGGPPTAPAVVYIHGGYWQEGDRTLYAFIAKELNAAGINVVIPSYSLCPAVSVLEIVAELRTCMAALWSRLGIHPLVVGHSAGGHLTAAMLATEWADEEPDDLVRAGVAVSGVFDLRPLVSTSINGALRLDDETALAASPRFWQPPPADRKLIAVVGAEESSEFRRQSRDIAGHWRLAGLDTDYIEAPGTNHFTVIELLASAGTELFERVVALTRDAGGG